MCASAIGNSQMAQARLTTTTEQGSNQGSKVHQGPERFVHPRGREHAMSDDDRHVSEVEAGAAVAPPGTSGSASAYAAPRPSDALAAVVVRDIVPRLLIEHRGHGRAKAPRRPFSAQDVHRFLDAVLAEPVHDLRARLDDRLLDGVTGEQILLGLLTPVARRLGVLWETDAIDFIDVTVAIQKMQFLVRHVAEREGEPPTGRRRSQHPATPRKPCVVLLPAPGETHTFGLMILSEVLRQRGIKAQGGLPATEPEIVAMVDMHPDAIVGFSISCEVLMPALARIVAKIRKVRQHCPTLILVGGRLVGPVPDLAKRVGADAAFADAVATADHIAQYVRERACAPQ
jgi:methanogenic corrinoid protein MtbC1